MREGRKRRIRELLNVLDDPDQLWRPHHTNMLVDLVMKQGNGEREAFTTEISLRMAEQRRAAVQDRKQIFNEELERQLPQVAKALEIMTQYGFTKAIDPETGEIDVTKLNDKDMNVALKAMGLSMKSLGLLTTKLQVESTDSVFDAE